VAVVILLAPVFGWRIDQVTSGSMEPAIEVGSAVLTNTKVDTEDIMPGDIILYRSVADPNKGIAHRVLEKKETQEGVFFTTQGDANDEPDAHLVPAENLVGRVEYEIPILGSFADFTRSAWGFILLILIPTGLIIALEIRTIKRLLQENKEDANLETDPIQILYDQGIEKKAKRPSSKSPFGDWDTWKD
jgi:signal peptidase